MPLLAETLIRDVHDFPRKGVVFKDITPVLANAVAFRESVDRMAEAARQQRIDMVVGIESRGFLWAAPLALALDAGLTPARKLGKLPGVTVREEYALEYGTNTMEMQADALAPGQRVLIVDDVLATGGTALATANLVRHLGGQIAGFTFLVELAFLGGRAKLEAYPIHALVTVGASPAVEGDNSRPAPPA
jgi:adenine phosphoribosyltransferase